MTYKMWRVVGSNPTIRAEEMDPRTMLRGYQVARDALKYGRVDPLSYKLVEWELRLQRIGRWLLRLEVALQRGERDVSVKIVGGMAVFVLAVLLLPLYAIITLVLRYMFVFVLVQVKHCGATLSCARDVAHKALPVFADHFCRASQPALSTALQGHCAARQKVFVCHLRVRPNGYCHTSSAHRVNGKV